MCIKFPGQTSWYRLLAEVWVRIPTEVTRCKPLLGSYQLWTLHWSDIICALLVLRANKLYQFFSHQWNATIYLDCWYLGLPSMNDWNGSQRFVKYTLKETMNKTMFLNKWCIKMASCYVTIWFTFMLISWANLHKQRTIDIETNKISSKFMFKMIGKNSKS